MIALNKDKFFNVWSYLHVFFIVIVSIYTGYKKHCRFYRIPINSSFEKSMNNTLSYKPIVLYGQITGGGYTYGFFSPSVRSNGLIVAECDNKKIFPVFKTNEAEKRFGVMSSLITDYLANDKKMDKNESKDYELIEKYYELIFKSVATKIYNQSACLNDTLFVSYSVLYCPTLQEARLGTFQNKLIQLKEIKIFK